MTFKIIDIDSEDYFIVEGDTLGEVQLLAQEGVSKRGWVNVYSIDLDN